VQVRTYTEYMKAKTSRWRLRTSVTDDLDVPRGPQRPSETVTASLRQRIDAGEWAPGEALPTVAALSAHYGVARSTITRALATLEDEGLVRVISRWGTFRAEP
jgi:DNA-binding GntR family transcriptional regulator